MLLKNINKGNRILLLSIIATFVTLSFTTLVIFYYTILQLTQYLPTSYNIISPDWARFISPSRARARFIDAV